ncbi:MAG: hypothetical protein LVR00_08925 [Rhabdochlamydiaceae bacterium]|jgi:hypothetical protein
MLRLPSASIPKRFEVQKEIKGCYRFLNNKAVNHQMLQGEHYKNVLAEAASAPGRVLFIQDGSELIYNNLKWTELGPTADANGNGIMFHTCLAVKIVDNQPQVIGLTGQKAWIRRHKKEKANRKAQEARESKVWKEMIDLIGSVPMNCKWTTVGDRGADIFSFVESLPPGWDFVVRSKHDRKILVNDEEQNLRKYIRGLPSMGTTIHSLRARKGPSREVTLQISWHEVDVLPPAAEKTKSLLEAVMCVLGLKKIQIWSGFYLLAPR